MYRISLNGEVLAYKEDLNYIRKHENGCYVMTDRKHAEGVAVNGTAYNMYDTATHLEDCEYVVAQEIDTGDELKKIPELQEQVVAAEQSITDLDIANIEAQQQITDLELMILEV